MFTAEQRELGNRRLLLMARLLELMPQLLEGGIEFCQWRLGQGPLDFYMACHEGLRLRTRAAVCLHFRLEGCQYEVLFGPAGCGLADEHRGKAAAFLRAFVAERRYREALA